MKTVIALAALCATASGAAANVVEVGLGSGTAPYPLVANKISSREAIREGVEKQKLSNLIATYQAVEKQTVAQVLAALGRSSFLQLNPVAPSFRVKVVQSAADESSAAAAIDAIEGKRNDAEAAMLEQAAGELAEFGKVLISTVKSARGGRRSFLGAVPSSAEGYHKNLNIRVMADSAFPTISGMAASMEKRRDASEGRLRAMILNLQLNLAKRVNAVIRGAVAARG